MSATILHFKRKTVEHDIYITLKRDHRVCETVIYLARRRFVNPDDIIGFLEMSFQFLRTIKSLKSIRQNSGADSTRISFVSTKEETPYKSDDFRF